MRCALKSEGNDILMKSTHLWLELTTLNLTNRYMVLNHINEDDSVLALVQIGLYEPKIYHVHQKVRETKF